jgi:hypothetical protein
VLRRGIAVTLFGLACGRDAPPPPAEATRAVEAKRVDMDAAARAAKRKADEEARQREAEALAARLDALAVLPPKRPKTLEKACAQMLAAYDGFMRKVLQGDMLTKWTTGGNEMQLAVFRKECLKRSIEVAMCQARALEAAPPEIEPQLADLMGRCAAKFTTPP